MSEIKNKLLEMGQSPKRALGQNFLVNEEVIQKIIDAVRKTATDCVVEVGPGLGSLTEDLLGLGLDLRVIELDREFCIYWRKRNVSVIEADALRLNWEEIQLKPNTLLVSNLPYQISTGLVVDRCMGPMAINSMILMFQKEVAQRLMARPKTKAYGMLSVMAQTHFSISCLLESAPGDFYPPPKVASRVLCFTRKPSPVKSSQDLLYFLKAAFAMRRKFLSKNLANWKGSAISASRRQEAFKQLGLAANVRAEELDPEMFIQLYSELCKGDGI